MYELFSESQVTIRLQTSYTVVIWCHGMINTVKEKGKFPIMAIVIIIGVPMWRNCSVIWYAMLPGVQFLSSLTFLDWHNCHICILPVTLPLLICVCVMGYYDLSFSYSAIFRWSTSPSEWMWDLLTTCLENVTFLSTLEIPFRCDYNDWSVNSIGILGILLYY